MSLDSVNVRIPEKSISGHPDVGLQPFLKPGEGVVMNTVADFSGVGRGPKVGMAAGEFTPSQISKMEEVHKFVSAKAKAKIERT